MAFLLDVAQPFQAVNQFSVGRPKTFFLEEFEKTHKIDECRCEFQKLGREFSNFSAVAKITFLPKFEISILALKIRIPENYEISKLGKMQNRQPRNIKTWKIEISKRGKNAKSTVKSKPEIRFRF